MKRIMAAAAVVLLVATGCDPAPTITTKGPRTAVCAGYMTLEGTVEPIGAMKSVVIQRTVNGKWVDWLWYVTSDSDEERRKVVGSVSDGAWQASMRVPFKAGEVIHLRARASAAAGGANVVSKGVYVTVVKPAGWPCPNGLFFD